VNRALPVALAAVLAAAVPCVAQSLTADDLAARKKLGIPLEEARRLQSVLGQLLVVNVDGFGYSGPLALEPEFAPMVSRLQIGGVIPHYGSTSYERIRRTNRALAGLTDLPLLICSDIVKLRGTARTVSFGDGYIGGFLGRFAPLADGELRTLAELNAFTFASLGINTALGPTVDTSTRDPRTAERARLVVEALQGCGLQVVLKHFPYLPGGANLHRESPDTRLPLEEAEKRSAIFHELAGSADIMMTTHLLDTEVDASLVTFSRTWNTILREQTGFTGPLMSDGLLMLKNYTDRRPLTAGASPAADFPGIDETASWAARAILAGHDMVIVEGSPAQTVRVFNGLLTAACGRGPAATALKGRIFESAARIARWKKDRESVLRRVVDVPPADIERVIALLPPDGASAASLASFRFDAAGLARLRPALESAALTR
jgi:beta-glucosidase-like glycosyl hydrolase